MLSTKKIKTSFRNFLLDENVETEYLASKVSNIGQSNNT